MGREQSVDVEQDASTEKPKIPSKYKQLLQRVFGGKLVNAIGAAALAATLSSTPVFAESSSTVPVKTVETSVDEMNSSSTLPEADSNLEQAHDLSDYRLPFDGTHKITQGRSAYTIDGQECNVNFHTTHQNLAKESVDFLIPGGVPIKAAQAGKVIHAGWMNEYGLSVIIQHQDGLTSWYGHFSEKNVQVGDEVGKGEIIGTAGKSGNWADHLHFEIRNGDNQSIPLVIEGLQYFGGFEESCSYKERFEGYGQYPPPELNELGLPKFNPQVSTPSDSNQQMSVMSENN